MSNKPQPPRQPNELSNNVRRLLGLHDLRATRDSRLFDGLSPQALSEIQSGTRSQPRIDTLEKLSSFFEISIDRLLKTPFEDLLSQELADVERYRRVEQRIAKARST